MYHSIHKDFEQTFVGVTYAQVFHKIQNLKQKFKVWAASGKSKEKYSKIFDYMESKKLDSIDSQTMFDE